MAARRYWQERPRWLRRLLMGSFAGLLAIPILTNLALWLGIVPRLLNADSASLHYGFAWSPWPTRVRVHELGIDGQDQNVQFAIAMDEAWLTLDLWAAVSERCIKITKVRGSGTSVRVVQRLQPWDLRAEKIRALPAIPGRSRPPVTEDYVPGPRATARYYDLISLDVSDVDAGVEEVWIDDVRLEGDLRAIGSFSLRPGLELRIGPIAEATIRAGKLSVGGRPMLAAMTGLATCHTPTFNPVRPPGLAIAAFFSGSLAMSAELLGADFLNYALDSPEVRLRGGSGRLDLDLTFDSGTLNPRSRLSVESRLLEVDFAEQRLRASLALLATIDEKKNGNIHASIDPISFGKQAGTARFEAGKVSADLRTRGAMDLSKTLPPADYSATLSGLTGKTAVLQSYLPNDSPVTLDRGQLDVEGEVTGTTTEADLLVQLRLRSQLTAHADKRRFEGKAHVYARARETADGFGFAKSSLDVSDLQVAQGEDVTYGWWTHVEVTDGGYIAGDNPRLGVQLKGLVRDIEPLYVALGDDIGIPGWLQGLLPLKGTSFGGHVALEAGAVRVSQFTADSGVVHIRGKLKKPAEAGPSGAVKIASGPLSFGVAFTPERSGSELLATDAWFDRQP